MEDDLLNEWLAVSSFALTFGMNLAFAKDVAGGNVTVTAYPSFTGTIASGILYELGPCGLDLSGWFYDGSALNTHYSSKSAGIDVAADSLVIAVGRSNSASLSTITEGSGYTKDLEYSGNGIVQSKAFNSAGSGERASWSSATARQCGSMMFAFRNMAVGGGGAVIVNSRRNTLIGR